MLRTMSAKSCLLITSWSPQGRITAIAAVSCHVHDSTKWKEAYTRISQLRPSMHHHLFSIIEKTKAQMFLKLVSVIKNNHMQVVHSVMKDVKCCLKGCWHPWLGRSRKIHGVIQVNISKIKPPFCFGRVSSQSGQSFIFYIQEIWGSQPERAQHCYWTGLRSHGEGEGWEGLHQRHITVHPGVSLPVPSLTNQLPFLSLCVLSAVLKWRQSKKRCSCWSWTRRMPWTGLNKLRRTKRQLRREANRWVKDTCIIGGTCLTRTRVLWVCGSVGETVKSGQRCLKVHIIHKWMHVNCGVFYKAAIDHL